MRPGEWSALVGWSRDGRGRVTREIVSDLRARGLRLGGCLQETLRSDQEIVGYDLVDLDDGRRVELARPSANPEICNWGFDPRAFATVAARVLDRAYDLVVLELGPIEARGQGHWGTVSALLEHRRSPLLLCIRPRALARIALELPDPVHALELPADAAEVARFTRALPASAGPRLAASDPRPRA